MSGLQNDINAGGVTKLNLRSALKVMCWNVNGVMENSMVKELVLLTVLGHG